MPVRAGDRPAERTENDQQLAVKYRSNTLGPAKQMHDDIARPPPDGQEASAFGWSSSE